MRKNKKNSKKKKKLNSEVRLNGKMNSFQYQEIFRILPKHNINKKKSD